MAHILSDARETVAIATEPGFRLLRHFFDEAGQRALLNAVGDVLRAAPLYRAAMPKTGAPMGVAMTNCGPLGWVSDVHGYRYQPFHPVTGLSWPPMPTPLLDLWSEISGFAGAPEACLVNFYAPKTRLGLHVDADEDAKFAPVVSVSLGAAGLFRLGGAKRTDSTTRFWLFSGDVVVLGGASRRWFHGVDRIDPTPSALLGQPGRVNLTLRRVTRFDPGD